MKLKNNPELDTLANGTQQIRDKKNEQRGKLQHHIFIKTSNMITSKSYGDAFVDSHWQEAMKEVMEALHEYHTWSLVPRPTNINIVSSKWIFLLKSREMDQ